MPKVSANVLSRPPLDRMQRIHELIKAGGFPNANTFSKELGVSVRTLKRDLEFMRERLGLPMEYHPTRYGYFYTKEVAQFPMVAVTEAEMFALLVADKAIAQYRGMPFHKPLEMAFRKLTGQLDGQEHFSVQNLEQAISFRPFAPEDADLNAFWQITQALKDGRVLKFDYRNLGTARTHSRLVEPYHLACIDNHWYLFGHDRNRKAIRTFALSRLSKLVLTEQRFKKPRDFDPDDYLKGSFTVMKGDQDFDIVIEFDAWAADLVRGRLWHRSQEFTELSGGRSRLQMRLNNLEEIERWVLSWGTHATVISPPELSRRVQQTAAQIAKRAPNAQ